ncbi:MAG: DUF3237 domain-containing protein [Nisaea sp.]|jgi:hypothetical protein|uniref:DUF3237 domain-containing protein n=1 Tax=Nisaea sp. TaxID=2024842 RepID=UPI001B110561|nr:DUF3237 domain-containing protein [Nisaea sp.]MBO6561028.1 DUF3237 domain-containing protein [Nisaea sp.]
MRAAPGLRPVCTLTVELSPIRELGRGRAGKRRIIPIVGGRVEGPELQGTILNVGADWQTIYDDGCAFLDARYAFETPDGALIEVVNKGFRHGPQAVIERLAAGEAVDPDEYYMRTAAHLETGDPRYDWVNRTLFVGTGARLPSAVEIALFAVA